MIIRPFTPKDAPAISMIMIKTIKFNIDGPETKAALAADSTPEKLIAKSHDRTFFVAEEQGTILGIAGHKGNQVKTVFVDPDRHREGIGRALMTTALQAIKDAGYTTASVNASSYAEGFYEKFGFVKEWRKQVPFHGAPLTIVFMTNQQL